MPSSPRRWTSMSTGSIASAGSCSLRRGRWPLRWGRAATGRSECGAEVSTRACSGRSTGAKTCAASCSARAASSFYFRSAGSRPRSESASCSMPSHSRRASGDVRLVIAGDGPARRELELTAPAGTRFVGELTGAQLAALYASADAFCFPRTTDPSGPVLLEAGASGLPVIAADAGGAGELVAPGRTGLLVPPDEPGPLAGVLLQLLAEPELRARLGAGGRDAALARTW